MTADVHADWLARWAPELAASPLRDELVSGRRYRDRIEVDLLDTVFGLQCDLAELAAGTARVASLLARLDAQAIRRAGLVWCAPVLGRTLRPLAGLSDIPNERATVRLILENRRNVGGEHAAMPADAAAIDREGKTCLDAWIDEQDVTIAARLRLRRTHSAHEAPVDRNHATARAAAFEKAVHTVEGVG